MKMIKLLFQSRIIIFLFLATACKSSFAQTAASLEPRVALVIGNSKYTDSVSPLKNPVNDAVDVSAKLQSLGWQVVSGIDGERRDMLRKLAEFRDLLKAKPNATALFFYAGHGVQIDGINYLLPIGESFESLDDVRESAISLDRIYDVFHDAKALRTVVILDACRDNPFTQKTRSISATRGLAVVPAYELGDGGSAVIFATMPNEVAADGTGRNGVFTESLLAYIDQGYNLQEMYLKVKDDVKAKTSGKQNPSLTTAGVLTGFYLGSTIQAPLIGKQSSTLLTTVSADTFRVRVQGPAAGISVMINGKDVGKTPLDTVLPKGIYTLELVHPDWTPWKETVKPNAAGLVDISPKLERSDSWKIAQLVNQRDALQANKDSLKRKQKVPKTITISSIGVTALGIATSTVAYLVGNKLRDAYDSAATASEAASARSKLEAMTLTFQVGIIAGGTGLAGTLFGYFTTPKTVNIEKQIKVLEEQIDQFARTR